MLLEICVDSLDSVIACAEAGADRIELCASLTEGGLTPSAGILSQARALFPGEIAFMIRPRGGDFAYREPDGALDLSAIETLLDACDGFPAVFHRAFDVCRDLPGALEILAELGFERILTSGGAPSVIEALDPIAALVQQAAGRIDILPGGGIKADQVAEIIRRTGVNQIHLSARTLQGSAMTWRRPDIPMGAATVPGEYERRIADVGLITAARQGLGQARAE